MGDDLSDLLNGYTTVFNELLPLEGLDSEMAATLGKIVTEHVWDQLSGMETVNARAKELDAEEQEKLRIEQAYANNPDYGKF